MSLLSSSKTMDSSTPHSDRAQNECDFTIPAAKHGSSCGTLSLSSSSFSSCSSSNFHDESPPSPATPLQLTGVPFSWEHLPGIPKKSIYKKKDATLTKVLPLPPPAVSQVSKRLNFEEISIRKKISNGNLGRDPFFAALVECSKDDDDEEDHLWNSRKTLRSISDRFGFINLYTSCRRTSDVSESIVYVPRSSRASCDVIARRPR